MSKNFLLSCGIFSTLLYVILNIFIPPLFKGYDIASQTVSELSAIDAPTRSIWVPFASIYVLLFAAFGWGIWKSAFGNKNLKRVARITLFYVLINFYWPPMHLRGNEMTLTDTLHIAWAMATLFLMMLIMGFGAAALGRSFRIYTALTFVIFIVFGLLIGTEAPNIAQNLPTPHIGIWERINIAAFMVWVAAFALALIRRNTKLVQTKLTPAL